MSPSVKSFSPESTDSTSQFSNKEVLMNILDKITTKMDLNQRTIHYALVFINLLSKDGQGFVNNENKS
jgi:hypothetical protein